MLGSIYRNHVRPMWISIFQFGGKLAVLKKLEIQSHTDQIASHMQFGLNKNDIIFMADVLYFPGMG